MFSALRGWPLGQGALRRGRQLSSESTPRQPQPHPGLLRIQRQQIAFRARSEELITDIQVPHGISTHVGCTHLADHIPAALLWTHQDKAVEFENFFLDSVFRVWTKKLFNECL